MEQQEPVYVISDTLQSVCERALGQIYDVRKTKSQQYVEARTREYNLTVAAQNNRRARWSWLGVKPRDYLTPFGMEEIIHAELEALAGQSQEAVQAHPMCAINAEYGEMEHMAKDAMIQCSLNESVLVSSDMARCISHLGIPLDFCKRRRIGFLP